MYVNPNSCKVVGVVRFHRPLRFEDFLWLAFRENPAAVEVSAHVRGL